MTHWLDTAFSPWGWLVVALVLGALEILAPGAFMIWLAGAALATAVVVGLVDPAWQVQLAIFAAFAVASVLLARRGFRRHPIVSDDPSLNRRGERLIGETVTVVEPIRGGAGRVRVGDSPWMATGPDMEAGATARIVAVDGARLHVERIG